MARRSIGCYLWQVLVTSLLNKMVALAPSLNHRVLVQIEAEIAGFNPSALQQVRLNSRTQKRGFVVQMAFQIVSQHGASSDGDSLSRELDVWRFEMMAFVRLSRNHET